MALKQHDFVELTYTGRLAENNNVFDTTDKDVAKKEGLPDAAAEGPIIIKLGEGQLLKGLEDQLVGKELGNHKVTLEPDNAFGKKVASKLQIIPTKKFIEQKIMPEPGVQISMDGVLGTVRSVSGGRTIVDFNHPLSGKSVTYDVSVARIVTDAKEKLTAMVHRVLGVKECAADIDGKDGRATVALPNADKLPDGVAAELANQLSSLTGVANVTIVPLAAKKQEEKEKAEKKQEEKNNLHLRP